MFGRNRFRFLRVRLLMVCCVASITLFAGCLLGVELGTSERLAAQVPSLGVTDLAAARAGRLGEQESLFEGGSEAGEEDEIETDRDSFTPATTTAGLGRLILEGAYSFVDNRDTYETHSFPEFVGRYGVAERIEIRLGWNYEIGGEAASISGGDLGEEFFGTSLVEEHQVSYGVKFGLTEQNGWRPTSAMIVQGCTPTGGPHGDSSVIATYVFGWKLDRGWRLDASMRYGTDSEHEDHGNLWAPSVVLKVPFGEQWSTHLEYFGIFSDGFSEDRSAQYISPGVHYLIHPNLELGVRLGWGLNEDAVSFFANTGIGYRF